MSSTSRIRAIINSLLESISGDEAHDIIVNNWMDLEDFANPPSRWEDDTIQFPRLLAEIMATQDNLNLHVLANSMDLHVDYVRELFDRAQREWERAKAEV